MPPVSTTQRLVPIRPSPLKHTSHETIVISTVNCGSVSMKTSAKRKLSDNLGSHDMKCKRLHNGAGNTGSKSASQAVAMGRRNARERNRVKQVNNSFLTLRQHVPGAAKAKKMSKVETLKQATEYIRNLQRLLEEHDNMLARTEALHANLGLSSETNLNGLNNQSQYLHHSPVPSNVFVPTPKDESCSPDANSSYEDQFYNENVSPVSPCSYSLNIPQRNHITVSSQTVILPHTQNIFKAEVNFTPENLFVSNSQPTEEMTSLIAYPSTPTPITPVSLVTFNLSAQPSSPYSTVAGSRYPTIVTSSPSSVSTQSSDSVHGYSPTHVPVSSISLSPANCSPAAATAAPNPSFFSSNTAASYDQETIKPSLINARNFIIPPDELPYCMSPGITTIDIDKVTATTKADLDLLDAISLWQDS